MQGSIGSGDISWVGELAARLGFPVTAYDVPDIEWRRPIPLILTLPVLYVTVLNSLRSVLHLELDDPRRRRVGWLMIAFVVVFPLLWGSQSSGSKVVDFALAVIAFVVSLRLYRIAFMRPASDTSTWTAIEYFGRLFTFPTEYEDERNSTTLNAGPSARIENAKDLGMAAVKVVVSLFFIRGIPPPEAFADMSWFQQRVYYAVLGGILLVCLEGFVGGFFGAYGLVCNRHMRHMFNHPLLSCGFKDLWGARWNIPVHDILKNVVFRGITFPASQYLHSSGPSSSPSPSPKTRDTSDTKAEDKVEEKKAGARSAERVRRSFSENATAAFLTFLVSGLFHEAMSYMAFGEVRWANVRYFSYNALGCTVEVLLEQRLLPRYARIKRTPAFRLVFVALWAWGSELYTDGYLTTGFFEEAKVWIGLLFPPFAVREVVWLPLVGRPVRGNW